MFLANGGSAAFLLVAIPGLAGAVLAAAFRRQLGNAARRLAGYWWLVGPGVGSILIFCVVFVDRRYIAGPLVVLGVMSLAALLAGLESRRWIDAIRIQAVVFAFVLLAGNVILPLRVLSDPGEWLFSQQVDMASELRTLGLAAGDRVGYIGMGMNAHWAYCAGVRIVAEVPVRYRKQGSLVRSVELVTSDTDMFWSGDPARRAEAIAAMKSSGARAIVADFIPPAADLSGWKVLRARNMQFKQMGRVAVLFIDR
jgi:hypothetical protein